MSHKHLKYQELLILFCYISGCLGDCTHEGKDYVDGESWNFSCNICNCFSNAVSCTKNACSAISCQPGETLTHHPSECCPQCLPYKRPCNLDSVTFAHNDVWSSGSKCSLYQCQDGTAVPFIIQCPSLYCVKGEMPFTAPGKCCPVCSLTSCEKEKENGTGGLFLECIYDNSSEHCENKSNLKENLLWKNPCTFCLTENGYVNCYKQKCPDCSTNKNNNDLCCPCLKHVCDENCLKCLDNDTSHCTYCKDPSKVLHNGKCLEECPKGFFKDEYMHCANCPTDCKSCFGNMSSQCTSCKTGFLLQKGHCIKACDVNFYESNGYCLECHESCSSCVGPSEEDCIACVLSGQLLQGGKCVDSCDGHFYVSDDGYCLSCNESCVRCLKNGSCQYCERGFYLQDGMCLPECYPGYYLFLDAYCLPCHEECQECFGPLPFQCTSCPFNQYLLKNSCVDACGQGYYGDLGAGLCRPCHPKCRNCLDTSSDDKCLSCSSGYLLPYIGTHFGPCVENCPDQYYLMESGICDTCHETCETCFGPSELECFSCNKTLFFKNGACVPHCSTGYFEDDGICYACHPSCSTCHGFTENDCYTCPHGRKLKYGKCIPMCPEGKYSDSNGLCTDCHSSCSDCYLSSGENKTVHCIKCKNQQYSIYKDECIPECSSVFYLNSHNTCTECHSSCATCEKTGATSCASCWDGNFLTHFGTCEHQCHQGYFSSNGICESCSLDCHECISVTECIKCKGDLVLQFGKCVPNCSKHFYLDTVTRQCKECSNDCSSCRGPLSSDCLSCYAGKLFEDGTCVDDCSEGFFQERKICKTCDLQCQTCSTLNSCTSCNPPYFLLKNECVDDCSAGYYPDYETQSCKECSVGCISCASSDFCALCFDGYYLLNFECITQCPSGYYGNPLWRVCQKNEDVPSLHANTILKAKPARKILISASYLSASDSDSDSLVIILSQVPRNGLLVKMSEKGEEVHLKVGANFTSMQLKDGWIFFKHLQGIPLKGDVALKVSDGQLIGNEIVLPLVVSSEFSPVIEQIQNIILTEDSSLVLNTSYISIQDPDNPNDITLEIVESPCSAKLVLLPDQREIKTFSYEDFIQSKLILKTYNKPVTHEDKFIIQVSDGFNSVIAEIKIFILPKEQKELFLLHNNPLLAKYDEFTRLTNDHLHAVSKELLARDIVFNLEKSYLTPYGSFFKTIDNSYKNKKISSSKISFTQKDINEELISYKHSDNTTTSIIIPVKVTNTKSKAELKFNFEIKIALYNDTLILAEEAKQFGMMVLQNHPATITSDHLQMQLNSIPNNDIVYMIIKRLTKEEGFLENLDNPGYRIQSFTQKDIDDLKIVYHPPPYLEASETNYVFQFIVLDARSRVQLSPVQNFSITVRPLSSEFTSPSSSVDHVATIVVPQGHSVDLGSNWLSTVGHQMPEDQLEVVLTIAPQHGNLTLMQNGYDIKIEEEDGFSFTSIIHDTYYIHDGSNNFKDYAILKIMGGPYSSLNRIDFMISPNDKESPVILDSTSLMASVIEGNYLDLRRHHLAYTDLVSADDNIIFTLLNKPSSGNLTKYVEGSYIMLQKGDTFTQQDINDRLIRFYARDPIGNYTIRENLYFDVSDGSGNVQPNQPLLMKVKPKVREPPVVKVTTDVKVNEGGDAIIEPHVITVFDPDSPLSDLIAYIEVQPEYGFLENSRPIPGAEKSLAGIPISSFSYIDLVEGYIKYIQLTHRDMEPERDAVYIRISDGFLSSPAHLVNITIKPMNDEVPSVHTQHLTVLQGSFAKVLNSSLSVTDEDTGADQLYIRLENPPQKGGIRLLASNTYNLKNSKALLKQDTFTFQDVLNGLIMYVHEAVQSHENDSFSFTVSDGHHDISGSIDIYVIVRDREVPYLERNLGLELLPGESSIIDNKILSALDSDSPVELLRYVLTSDPSSGELFMMFNGKAEKLSSHSKSAVRNFFSQSDIDSGRLFYHHFIGNPVGLHHFKFNIIDPANNTLMNQKFFISIFEDLFPPVITVNTGLEVEEKSAACIDSTKLAAIDEHQKDRNLMFSLTSLPTYGYLAIKMDIGKPITSFFMSDLNAGQVCYVHKSERENFKDSFIFTVSDGKNYILQSFHINITFPHKTLPFVKIYPLYLDEGSQKAITEFEIDIFDRDSADSELILTLISPPKHGKLVDSKNIQVKQFSYEDIRLGHISYVHDDSDTISDNFTILVADGSSEGFITSDKSGKNITTKNPLSFPVKIFPEDDMYPVLLKNEGLQMLKKDSDRIWNVISETILFTDDADTEKENILYRITLHPHFGSLELTSQPDVTVFQFTQKNIENQELVYVLKNDDLSATEDNFIFSVEDTKPNRLYNNIFTIRWTRIHFISSVYNISETSGLLELPIKRTGNTHLDFTASCKMENVNPEGISEHLISIVDEINFKVNDMTKFCIFRIIDNEAFEGTKKYKIFLKSNISLLASPHVAVIFISDVEDEPTISFKEEIFRINETDKYFSFPIIRQGDLSQELSVLCNTSDVSAIGSNTSSLQTGSDYRSRDSSYHNIITFNPGVAEMMCTVKIIDDNLFEHEEEFHLLLSKPHPVGQILNHTLARVIIEGPNDAPYIIIQDKKYEIFHGEHNSSVVILRQGVDISGICTVWCWSYLLSHDKNEKILNSYYQITFEPFESSAVCFVPTNSMKQTTEKVPEAISISIDSPSGCLIGEPNKISVPLMKKIIYPIVEFKVDRMNVSESAGSVNITVQRTGDISSSATLYCITEDGTATSREDFEERYKTRRNSLIHFSPRQKESFCSLYIYDDNKYEGNESFQVLLSPLKKENEIVTIGLRKSVTVEIVDTEDVTVIEFEKSHYLVTQNSFPNSSVSAVITVVRHGDTSLLSKVRISTIDGSAASGLDYYAKSKIYTFLPGEKKKIFEIEILYNKRRSWALSFLVILGPDEVMNAEIGNACKATVTIPRVESTESLILPSIPIVISLIHFDDVKKGTMKDAKSGYPLICITPCDVNYPDYSITSALCRESKINASSLNYSWEIAMPLNNEENLSPFKKVTDSTLFTSANEKVLDSVYFRPYERVRCIVQPVDSQGHLGISLRSQSIRISSESGFCLTSSRMQYLPASLASQPFIATLNYINSSDAFHPNKLHIHIEVPHEDGLLPLLSTYPLRNIEFLLMHSVYRQQHVCSNLLQRVEKSFLKSLHPQLKDVKSAFPYHPELITKEMQLIYQHLDLMQCKWSFDAWYSMSDLVELCGGSVTSDFKARETDKTYVSVVLPFYATYVFAAAPTGWTSVEHRTEIEFSFFYDTFLWKAGSYTDGTLNASLSIVRIGTDSSGHLFFEFKTVAKFYGCFVLEHHTLPGIKSHVTVPNGLNVKFSLQLLWSEQSFDGPTQIWKATSNYNLKDYSGRYVIHLIPCEVAHAEQFAMLTEMQFLPCIAQVPQKFQLPITFQQTLRPQPVTYALETFFQLFNDKNLFLLNPFEKHQSFQYIEYKGAFSKGEKVYGRVFWSPEQELESAYQLKISEVLLCTGKNGFVPLYDPTGKIYDKGPQYGCLLPNKNLRHKFTLLDRHHPDIISGAFQGLPFNAEFIENSLEYEKLHDINGVDGFVFNIDPLYELSSSQQWFLQVTYSIKPIRTLRIRRSLENTEKLPMEENLTNIKLIFLKMDDHNSSLLQFKKESRIDIGFGAHHIMYLISAILIVLGILIIGYKNPKSTVASSSKVFERYYKWMDFKTKNLSNQSYYNVVECRQKVKQTEKCMIKVPKHKDKISNYLENSSETEV